MSNLVIPKSIPAAFAATSGNFHAVFTKPAGTDVATVFVAGKGSDLTSVSKATASATFTGGVLHVNLGSAAAGRSSAGLAAEEIASKAGLAHGVKSVTAFTHG